MHFLVDPAFPIVDEIHLSRTGGGRQTKRKSATNRKQQNIKEKEPKNSTGKEWVGEINPERQVRENFQVTSFNHWPIKYL